MKLKLKLPKIKLFKSFFSPEAGRFWYLVIVLIMIGVLGAIGFFLYRNLYQTIAQSEEIILLRKEVAPNSIEVNKVKTVLDGFNAKTTAKNIDFGQTKNPFISQTPPPTPAIVTTTTTPQ